MRYCHIFKKEGEEYDRYWLSISTERLDKKGEGTGEYVRTSIGVRLSKDAAETFEDNCIETSNKKVLQGAFNVQECFFKAVEPREGEPFPILFITDMEPEDVKPSKKPRKN